jgi:molybdopterin converting factor subunit 1
MKRLTIRLFATLRERAGAPELTRDFSDEATVAQIWQRLKAEFPPLEGHRDSVRFAVNQEYVGDDCSPQPGDEIAFIPPVSGGSDDAAWVGPIKIVRDRIDVGVLEAAVADPVAGAICTFVGATRENNAGRKVLRLEYEAYEAMAISEMRRLAEAAGRKWKIVRIAITHRVGIVAIGETSVAIAVSAAHRAEAFEACRFAIDQLKEIVPIWKKEHFEGGEVWIGCQTSHPPDPVK